jgi:tetratricopeptide (TPR) repeat protein
MDCRMSVLAAFSMVILSVGCVHPQQSSQNSTVVTEIPHNAVIEKPKDGPKRPPLPGTVVAVAVMNEREAEKAKDAALQIKMYDQARQYYQEALKIDPKYRDAVQGLARTYTRMSDYEHALDIYQKALDKNNKDHGLWFDMGMCYSRQQNLPKALPCFQKAMELDPENRQYMKQLGFTLARVGQTEESLALLTRAMGTALAHYNLARMFEHLGKPEECKHHLELALQINPNLEQARVMLTSARETPTSPYREPVRATLQFSAQ